MVIPETWEETFLKFYRDNKKTCIVTLCCALTLITMLGIILSQKAYQISINGEIIGTVKSPQIIEEVEEEIKENYKGKFQCDIAFCQDIEVVPVRAFGKQVNSKEELFAKLDKILSVEIKAASINIDGKKIAVVKDKKAAENLIEDIKNQYIAMVSGDIQKVEIEEDLQIVDEFVSPIEVIDVEDARELILKGTEEIVTYEVEEGDTLWDIAGMHNISLEELINANPQLKSEHDLALGDSINLKAAKPLLSVNVYARVTYKEPIPFETKTEKDSSLWSGQEKVKQKGEVGVKHVVADAVFQNGIKQSYNKIEETIEKNPVTKVVAKGTKTGGGSYYAYAPTSYRGSGRFSWPTIGGISSPFGRRGREFHTGIDITGGRGTAVKAANNGVVTFAGRRGGYGNLVIINHGGGFETYYAHNSTINVSAGQNVNKGQTIATVGSTGRATGPHLHFEVRVNGSPVNPLSYLGK